MTTRAEARAHVMAGGTIEYEVPGYGTIQRRYRDGEQQRRYVSTGSSWERRAYGFCQDPDCYETPLGASQMAVAIETVRLLPIPQKVKCDTREEAVEHMLAGGVIEYRNDKGLRRRKIVDGVEMDWAEYDGQGWLEAECSFMGNADWLDSLAACRENVLVYETLYLLPIED